MRYYCPYCYNMEPDGRGELDLLCIGRRKEGGRILECALCKSRFREVMLVFQAGYMGLSGQPPAFSSAISLISKGEKIIQVEKEEYEKEMRRKWEF